MGQVVTGGFPLSWQTVIPVELGLESSGDFWRYLQMCGTIKTSGLASGRSFEVDLQGNAHKGAQK